MSGGCGLPPAQPGVGHRMQSNGTAPGSPTNKIVPQPADSINGMAAGTAYTSTATDGVWICTYAGANAWTVTGPS